MIAGLSAHLDIGSEAVLDKNQTGKASILSTESSDSSSTMNSDTNMVVEAPPFYPSAEVVQAQVRTQLDYYFSPLNLARDSFMLAQMDSEGFIPVAVISGFKKLRLLCGNFPPEKLIVDTLLSGPAQFCELSEDNTRLRGRKAERNTIILREVHQEVTEAEINELLKDFPLQQVVRDVADTWFVKVDTEETAKDALAFLLHATLRGQSIKARLKSESFVPEVAQQPVYAPMQPVYPPEFFYQQYVPHQQQMFPQFSQPQPMQPYSYQPQQSSPAPPPVHHTPFSHPTSEQPPRHRKPPRSSKPRQQKPSRWALSSGTAPNTTRRSQHSQIQKGPEFKTHDFPSLPGATDEMPQQTLVSSKSWAEKIKQPVPPAPSPPPPVVEKEVPVSIEKKADEVAPVAAPKPTPTEASQPKETKMGAKLKSRPVPPQPSQPTQLRPTRGWEKPAPPAAPKPVETAAIAQPEKEDISVESEPKSVPMKQEKVQETTEQEKVEQEASKLSFAEMIKRNAKIAADAEETSQSGQIPKPSPPTSSAAGFSDQGKKKERRRKDGRNFGGGFKPRERVDERNWRKNGPVNGNKEN